MLKQWLPFRHTIGDFVRTVLAIDNEQDAKSFYDWQVQWVQGQIDNGTWKSDTTAEQAAKMNIGWCYGEGMSPDRVQMWVKVCDASHPIFGITTPTAEQAFEAGRRAVS